MQRVMDVWIEELKVSVCLMKWAVDKNCQSQKFILGRGIQIKSNWKECI